MNLLKLFGHNGSLRISKMELMGAFALARRVEHWDESDYRWVSGLIRGITLESGFTPPDTPHHFIVEVLADEGRTARLYVRTVD